MTDQTDAMKKMDRKPKSLLLVFGALACAFIASFIASSLINNGGFSYLNSPLLVKVKIVETLGSVLVFPLIHIAIASIWKSKRNRCTRRNILFGWAVVIVIVYTLGYFAQPTVG